VDRGRRPREMDDDGVGIWQPHEREVMQWVPAAGRRGEGVPPV
jgi:hypothetical protein